MKHVYILVAMAAGIMTAFSLVNKEQSLKGHVTTNSSEIEAIWYPE
jgi:hypothetical protein